MKAVSEVSIAPKNRPMPSAPTTGASTRGRNSSRAGACSGRVPSTDAAPARAVGCRANALTKIRPSTAAPITGAAGLRVVARRPTITGPKTNTISSAADSYAIAPFTTGVRRSFGYARPMMPTRRLRESGATWGMVAPMKNATERSAASGTGAKASHAIVASIALLAAPAISSTRR